jgi:N-acetylated-alpha-linked acidic dipeptidase
MRADEAELVKQVSRDKLWETNSRIAEWVRISGSQDERESIEYIKGLLEAYGLRTTWLDHPALISYPVESKLQVVDGGSPSRHYKCLGHAFGASVENLEADLTDLGGGTLADYSSSEARGRVVLLSGLATPTDVYRAEQAGAVGEIFVNDDHLHNMIVSTVWGTPTPQSARRLPSTPVVSVLQADGRDLRARLASGSVRVRIQTNVSTGWRVTPILIGDVDGQENDEFVMLSGHVDSWHRGAMDNGSANATMLEVARLLAQAKTELHRGLRVIFWSGHSQGRYSGSTWYADHYWEELYDRCVAHVNVDSTGARGASYYGRFQAHGELGDFGARVIEEHTGQSARPTRMTRAGDMSFNGIGIPSLFMELSQMPVSRDVVGEMPWWWHTSEDTIDKVDLEVLELDTKIYLSAMWRLCRQALLPMDFRPVLKEMQRELAVLVDIAGVSIDLGRVQRRTEELAEQVEGLAQRASSAISRDEIAAVNKRIKSLSRILIPLTYTIAGRFEHDPAWDIPYLPGLQGVRELGQLDPNSDGFAFLQTHLARSQNSVLFALRQASEVLGQRSVL